MLTIQGADPLFFRAVVVADLVIGLRRRAQIRADAVMLALFKLNAGLDEQLDLPGFLGIFRGLGDLQRRGRTVAGQLRRVILMRPEVDIAAGIGCQRIGKQVLADCLAAKR